jgi:ElaB/YqjD/DUF883 family membrane-anchored ribosome-binding protein
MEDWPMNKDSIEGAARKAAGQVEDFAGRTFKDKQASAQGLYDQAAGSVQSAFGHAKDAVASGASDIAKAAKGAVDEVANTDLGALRDDLAKLTQTVSQLVQSQAASTRDQVMGAVATAGDNISQSAAVAQDKLVSIEHDLESRIRKNPWGAVAIAVGVGLLLGKMT